MICASPLSDWGSKLERNPEQAGGGRSGLGIPWAALTAPLTAPPTQACLERSLVPARPGGVPCTPPIGNGSVAAQSSPARKCYSPGKLQSRLLTTRYQPWIPVITHFNVLPTSSSFLFLIIGVLVVHGLPSAM